MKREELQELLPDADGTVIDRIMKMHGTELNPLKEQVAEGEKSVAALEAERDALAADKASLSSKLDDANKRLEEGMSAEELLAQREQAALEKEREFALKSNMLDAKALFVEAGVFSEEEIDGLVEQVAGEDAAKVREKAEFIVSMVKSQREGVDQAVRAELLKDNPNPQGNQGEGVVTTLKEFLSLPETEQLRMKAENPQILNELTRG